MNNLIKSSIEKGISYKNYRAVVKQLVEENTTTGNEKTDALINYTKLNDKRMKRWDKTVKVSEDSQKVIKEFNNSITWLVITESWCGDAAHIIPVLNKVAELNNNLDMKIVFRDENPVLMDAFLTNGGKAIPKVIMIDNESGEIVDTYGPRPSEATSYVNKFKAINNGVLTPEFKKDLQNWYNKNKGQNIIEDVTKILCEFETNVCQ